MHYVDHVFMLLLFLAQPLYGAFESRRYEAQARAGRPFNRFRFYRDTVVLEWAFLAALVAAWFFHNRPISDLGFVTPGGPGFWGGVLLLVPATGYLLYSRHRVQTASDSERVKYRQSFGKLQKYLPHTMREARYFYGASITAGIVEEIVYRGFVLWYLAQLMPLWAAVVVSSVAFGLLHSYQGANGVLRTGLAGLLFGIYYVVTGSIWLPIVAHVLLDALQGAIAFDLLREETETPKPQVA